MITTAAVCCAALSFGQAPDGPPFTVGSKSFPESVILCEIVTQLARQQGAETRHRSEFGGTRILFNALELGQIDAYPEYTGTITQEILAAQGIRTDDDLREALAARGLRMTGPLGFSNTYAVGVRPQTADELGLATVSDLRKHPDLRLGFSNEFMDRGDGWPSLRKRYRLPQRDVRGLEHALAYSALNSDAIQVTDLYSTDAKILKYTLRALEDDLAHFPAYQAVWLYRADLQRRAAHVVDALLRVEGAIDGDAMIAMNARVELDGVSESSAAAMFARQQLGVGTGVAAEESAARLIWKYTVQHLFLVSVSLAAAIVLSVPLGILAAKRPNAGQVILAILGIIQTIPAIALLVLLIRPMQYIGLQGIGPAPAIVALFLYSLLPIVRNTFTGLRDISPSIRESAEALGLPPGARLRWAELPIAARTILAGIKTAAVINVGFATLGGFIGAGGFGEPIFTGIRLNDPQWIAMGAIPAALLALLVQGLFEVAERALVPKGLRLRDVR